MDGQCDSSCPYSKYFCSKRGVRFRSLDVTGASTSSFVACNNAFKNMLTLHTWKRGFVDLLLIKVLMTHWDLYLQLMVEAALLPRSIPRGWTSLQAVEEFLNQMQMMPCCETRRCLAETTAKLHSMAEEQMIARAGRVLHGAFGRQCRVQRIRHLRRRHCRHCCPYV